MPDREDDGLTAEEIERMLSSEIGENPHHHHTDVDKKHGQATVLHWMRAETRRDSQFSATGGEINNAHLSDHDTNPSLHARAGELLTLGFLAYGPQRACRISGRVCDTYRMLRPGEARHERNKRPSAAMVRDRDAIIARLEEQIRSLGAVPVTANGAAPGPGLARTTPDDDLAAYLRGRFDDVGD
jgi:hypothetical protein